METLGWAHATIHVWAAGGGHGATTVAGALAILLRASVSSHDKVAYEWMWGKPEAPSLRRDITVQDAGVIAGSLPANVTNVVVLRGPCSLALRGLVHRSDSIDHLVLLREPWRPLRPQDAEAATGTRIDAEVHVSPRVARLADAGLLGVHLRRLEEFRQLRVWAMRSTFVAGGDGGEGAHETHLPGHGNRP